MAEIICEFCGKSFNENWELDEHFFGPSFLEIDRNVDLTTKCGRKQSARSSRNLTLRLRIMRSQGLKSITEELLMDDSGMFFGTFEIYNFIAELLIPDFMKLVVEQYD